MIPPPPAAMAPAAPPKLRLRVKLHWNEIPVGRAPVPLEETVWNEADDDMSDASGSGGTTSRGELDGGTTTLPGKVNFNPLFCVTPLQLASMLSALQETSQTTSPSTPRPMLDFFTVLTTHGLVLYDQSFSPVLSSTARCDAVNALLAHQLLVGPTDTFSVGAMTLRARTAPPLVLIAAYPKAVEARYAPALLVAMDKVVRTLCADLIAEDSVAWTVPVERARELEAAFMRELDKAENAVTKPVGPRKPLGGVSRSSSVASVGDHPVESYVSAASDASPGPGAQRPLGGGASPVGGRRMPAHRRKHRGRNTPGGDESDPVTPPPARKGKAARK
ncbi:hypothetical protein GGF32_008371 [Allomyces javanicus]|nr:hypothetical protein GGF32_008371 [Allomyces javanicus]